jgi:ATP-dependent helicase HrpA
MDAIDSIPLQPAAARRLIDQALTRDRGRLHGLWSRWQARTEDAGARAAFEQALRTSAATARARAVSAPPVTLDQGLPIAREAERIVALIRDHPVVVIAGETGSGKTTQLPKLCLAAGRGAAGMIGCTQPRRIAARAVARRVAEELGSQVGAAVGFQVRFNDQVGEDTRIKFMTDGILLAEIASDRWLSAYDTIIVDEAHERSLNIDFLLGYLKQLLRRRRDLKVIVTSATIDTARFSRHFDDAPVVEVEGRTFPVEVRYRPLEGEGGGTGEGQAERSVNEAIVAAVDEITRQDPRGDVLLFLPGEREIRDAHQALERRKYRETEITRCTRACPRATRTGCSIRDPSAGWCWPPTWPRPRSRCRASATWSIPATRGSSATARGRSWTACISNRSRRPAPTSARAAAGASPRACATAFTRRRISNRGPSSPTRRSVAPAWPG